MSKYIYELVEATEENYYTIGLFKSPSDARAFLEGLDGGFVEHNDGYECYEVRRREIGRPVWGELGDVVLRSTRREVYDEAVDDNYWEIKIEEVSNE